MINTLNISIQTMWFPELIEYINEFLDNASSVDAKHTCRHWYDTIQLRCVTFVDDDVNFTTPSIAEPAIQNISCMKIIRSPFAVGVAHNFHNLKTLSLYQINPKFFNCKIFNINTLEDLTIEYNGTIRIEHIYLFKHMTSIKKFKLNCRIFYGCIDSLTPINTVELEFNINIHSLFKFVTLPLLKKLYMGQTSCNIVRPSFSQEFSQGPLEHVTVFDMHTSYLQELSKLKNLKTLVLYDFYATDPMDFSILSHLESLTLICTFLKRSPFIVNIILPVSLTKLKIKNYNFIISNIEQLSFTELIVDNTINREHNLFINSTFE